jgi:hypothetical protein
VTPDKYLTESVKALHVECHFDLFPAGKEILRLQKKRFGLARSRFGTIASWLMRSNERKRQIARFNHWLANDRSGKLPLKTIKDRFLDWFLGERLDEWKRVFELLAETVSDNISQGEEFVFDLFQSYRAAQDKNRSSYMRGVSWKQVTPSMAMAGAKAVELLLNQIIKVGVWNKHVPNPACFLAALRNRPVDSVSGGLSIWRKMMVTNSYTIGDMWRSRGALGLIPLSHVWAYAYNVKNEIAESFIDRLTQGKAMFTPIKDTDFYSNYAGLIKDGWYIFGDNIARVEDSKEFVCDIAMSEILQAYLRQGDKGENFVWFPHLAEGNRQAPSGDPFTDKWNMEGDIGLINIWEEDPGLFPEENISLPDIIEPTDAFLGMGRYNGRLINMGVKLTGDSVDKRIPVYLKRTGGALGWAPSKVDIPRSVQTVVAYGLHEDVDLAWWYERVGDHNYDDSDYMSADERIEFGIKSDPNIIEELIDIIGERRLCGWWPQLEMEFMRRKVNEPRSSKTGNEGSPESD